MTSSDRRAANGSRVDRPDEQDVEEVMALRRDTKRLFESDAPNAEKKKVLRMLVEDIKIAPERLAIEITYRVPERVMKRVVAGALYVALHDRLRPYLTRTVYLPKNGRRNHRKHAARAEISLRGRFFV